MAPQPDPVLDASALDGSSPTRRRVLAHLATWGGAGLGGLMACSSPVPPLRVGAIMFPGYELMFVARELGEFDQQALRLIEMPSNTDTLRALAVGQLDAAALTLDELLTVCSHGVDLRAVLVLDVSVGADVVLGLGGVRKLADLKGRRIGVEDGAVGALMLDAALTAAGLRADQVRQVPMTLDRSLEMAEKQQVDALVTVEPWAARIEAKGARRLFDSTAIPDRIIDVLAVRGEVVSSHGAAIRTLVGAWLSGLSYLKTQPLKAAGLLGPRLQVPPDQVPAAYKGLELIDADANRRMMAPGGRLSAAKYRVHGLMLQSALIKRPVALDQLVDARFLPG